VLYAPPLPWFPPTTHSQLREKITRLLWLPNTALRFVGITAYGFLIAAVCGFSVLYLQRVYDVPLKSDIVFEILRRPWLPTEKITLSSGKTLVGYTMSIGIGWHVFLDEQTRTIQYLHATDVTNRAVCHLNKETKPNKQAPPKTPFLSPQHIEPGKIDDCF
jgi:hypothetical protein